MTRKEELLARVKQLRIEQRDLMLKEDRREITRNKFDVLIKPIEKEIREANQEILKILYDEQQITFNAPTKAEEKIDKQLKKIKEEKGVKVGRKRESKSWLSLVLKALCQKDTKNVQDVIAKVDKWRPGREKDKTEHQVKVVIYRVKKQYPGPYVEYEWDEKNFLLKRKIK